MMVFSQYCRCEKGVECHVVEQFSMGPCYLWTLPAAPGAVQVQAAFNSFEAALLMLFTA
jgi:hypothetical protein